MFDWNTSMWISHIAQATRPTRLSVIDERINLATPRHATDSQQTLVSWQSFTGCRYSNCIEHYYDSIYNTYKSRPL